MITRIYFILLLTGCFLNMNGQVNDQKGQGEGIILFSDRNLYISGEKILFSALIQENRTGQKEFSRILYCDLITSEGSRMSGGKYLIENSSSNGSLEIPGQILTGDYYLRAYTKYMRNDGPGNYSYTFIRIINPDRKEVQSSGNNDRSDGKDEENVPADTIGLFRITAENKLYKQDDSVTVNIDYAGPNDNSFKILSLSVVPENSISLKTISPGVEDAGNYPRYFPENLGISVTGKLKDNITGNFLKNTRINLSIIGKGRDFMSRKTDSAGGFYFSLPDYYGRRDLFLCAEVKSKADPQLLVDNDFCILPVHIPTAIFSLSNGEREAALKMALNLQVRSYFTADSITKKDEDWSSGRGFYGKPDEILYIEKYVQLPTLEEYFNSLTSMVRIRKRQGEKYVKILGPQTELSEFDPLVMVDLVAVEDLASILAIKPSQILKIEIVNELYVKGDQTYGGLINIISQHNDFAGINLPQSGIFINYGFLEFPDQEQQVIQGSPDTRNTLYWDPQLILGTNNAAKINFHSPDTPGKYIIVLNGVNSKGRIFRQTSAFEVVRKNVTNP